MWNVALTGTPKNKQLAYNVYGTKYFHNDCRKFRYKKEAQELQDSLKQLKVESELFKTIEVPK